MFHWPIEGINFLISFILASYLIDPTKGHSDLSKLTCQKDFDIFNILLDIFDKLFIKVAWVYASCLLRPLNIS